MKQVTRISAFAIIAILTALCAVGQRRVTPINNATTATQSINELAAENDSLSRRNLIETTDAKGNKVLVDTITGKEFVDSTAITSGIPKMIYPLLHSASVSVDLFTPAMVALGQKHGLVEFGAELNLHNRYMPVVEVGLGRAYNKPEDNNFTYRSPLSVFFRVGANYNFFYNSDPRYLLMAGVRYGISPFTYEVTDVTTYPGYWDEPESFNIPSQHVTVGYLDLMLGLRVAIAGNFSLGWFMRYHTILHESHSQHGEPWYIPGFGARGSSLGATFSLTYTFQFHKPSNNKPSDNSTE